MTFQPSNRWMSQFTVSESVVGGVNIVVLGGAGDMGSHVVNNIIEYSGAQVTIADYGLAEAQALARKIGERARSIFVDASNRDSLLLALRDADVAVGAIGPFYRFAHKMAWAALESQVPYVDICDDHGPIDILFEFDAVARRAGVTMITGLGWTPGLSNILARHGANQLDRVEEVHIAWAGSAADSAGLAVVKHVLYAVSGQVPTYRNGEWVKVPALSDGERVNFPEPLGEIEVFHVGHPEPLTIPKSIPAGSVSLKGALTPAWNNSLAGWLVRRGLTSTRKRIDRTSRLIHRFERLLGASGIPRSGLRVDVSGIRRGERVTLSYSAVDKMSRLTALPAALGAIMLARGEIEQPGVFAPEAIIEPQPFLDRLADYGIDVVEEETITPGLLREDVPAPEVLRQPTAETPARAKIPSAHLVDGRVAKVALGLIQERPADDEHGRLRQVDQVVPSAALRNDVVVDVVLNLDQAAEATEYSMPSR